MRQFRILRQVALETMLGLKQSGWSNWLVISILTIALTIFGSVLELTATLKKVVAAWGSQLEVSAYLKDDFDFKAVANQASHIPGVHMVEIIPKEIAWEEMQSTFKVAALNNPLPNTLHIKVDSPELVEKTAANLKLFPGVEHVCYASQVARSLTRFRHFLEVLAATLTIALTIATLILISNTIELVIQARQREIEIMSLMGISPWYIKGPLVVQGAAYGAASALLAIMAMWGVHFFVDPHLFDELACYIPSAANVLEFSPQNTFLMLLMLGVTVGAGGSAWTSGRYIKL